MDESWVVRVCEWTRAGEGRVRGTHSSVSWVSNPTSDGIVPLSDVCDRFLRSREYTVTSPRPHRSYGGTHSAATLPFVQDTPCQWLMHGSPTVQLPALLHCRPFVAT
jgi:hypothetical protein